MEYGFTDRKEERERERERVCVLEREIECERERRPKIMDWLHLRLAYPENKSASQLQYKFSPNLNLHFFNTEIGVCFN